ncbi:MAG: hypothetical protein ACJAYU_004687, partial [Bradymonadia bacterium]
YGALLSRAETTFSPEKDECEVDTTEVLTQASTPDDYAISDGVWSVVYQGELNNTERNDGVLMSGATDGRRWIEYAGEDPCEAGSEPSFCSESADIFDSSVCPELRSLCVELSSLEICEGGIDVCAVCPSACRGAVDFCNAGVLPNDIIEIERQGVDSESVECAPFGRKSRAELVDAARLEYVVCSVGEAYLEVAPLPVGCEGFVDADAESEAVSPVFSTFETIDRFPPEGCFELPLTTSVRASEWLVRLDDSTGPSPYRAVDGQCVLRADAEDRFMRLAIDHQFTSPFGLTMTVDGPDVDVYGDDDNDPSTADEVVTQGDAVCLAVDENGAPAELPEDGDENATANENFREIFGRDFALRYTVDRNFSFRSASSRQLLLGPATAAMAIGDTDAGRRIVIVDESQSFVWVYSASTYREVAPPLP